MKKIEFIKGIILDMDGTLTEGGLIDFMKMRKKA